MRGSYLDSTFGTQAIKVLPGEYLVTGEDFILVTLLGSCVAACIRDPQLALGGMNHFMLPETELEVGGVGAARYGAYAMEMLINDLLKMGALRSRLQAKVFGGAAVLPGFTVNNVGERNAEFVLQYLKAEGVPVLAQDLGDICPRRVYFFPATGRVMVKRLPSAQRVEVAASERAYQTRLRDEPAAGSVELFS
ncbi:MAG: chemoreceptor glutamine deamidase CheD [Nevskia sp.]|nr:chemoreceptor glutamine deamidase CheD [Nevskia sp.]